MARDAERQGRGGRARFWTQMHALFLKNLSFQRRNAIANATIAAFPVLVCVLLFGMQTVLDIELGTPQFRCGCACVLRDAGTGACAQTECGIQYSTPKQAPSCAVPSPQGWPALVQAPDALAHQLWCQASGSGSEQDCPVTMLLTGGDTQLSQALGMGMLPTLTPGATAPNSSNFFDDLSGVVPLGSSTTPADILYVDPAFAPNETLYVLQPQCPWNPSTVSATYNGVPLQYYVQCVQAQPLWCDNSSVINQQLFNGYKSVNKWGISNEFLAGYDFLDTSMTGLQVYILYNSTFSWGNNSDGSMTVLRVPRLVNMASTAYLKILLGADVKMDLDYLKEMPKPETKMRMDLTPLLDPLFFTWVLQLLLPITVTLLVYEKEHKLRLMMKMHGLKNAPYWLISYAYFLCLSTAYIALLVIFGSLLGLDIFRLNNYGVQFIFYFTYINLQIVLAFLFASFFSSTKTATVVSYIYVFGSGLLADSLFVYYIQDTTFPNKWLVTMELFPAFSLYRGIYDLAGYAYSGHYLGNHGMQWNNLNDSLNGVKDVLFLMSAEWVLLIPVAFLLDHWPVWQWHPLSLFYRLLSKKRSQLSGTLNEVNSKSARVSIDMTKPDALLESKVVERLLKTKMGKRDMVICDNLKKLYPGQNGNPGKLAVRGLSLALPRGQCFGMLGPSGSGKTSFLSMMIGLQMPSYGTAYIDGMDLRKDMDEIYANIGVCPQHDLLWETLTGREHLMFYGRMKNLTGVALKKAVEESLKSVDLFHSGFGDKPASTYSGGMKRRLSAAIALIGNPKVAYMDELSTGLDPSSRRYLWNAVKQAKKNCTIILTTHSMEEADKLCDRIGIFVDGDFHCLGTPIELKTRYGGAWTLTIMTEPKHEAELEELVNQLSPGASRIYSLSGTQKFTLLRREVGLDGVFRVVEMARRAFPVLGWGVAGATLEDVFIRVVKDAKGEHVADGKKSMTSANVVSKVPYTSQGKAPSQSSGNTLFSKNGDIPTSSTRIETSAEKTLRKQLITEQKSSAALVQQVDELKRKTEQTEREFEEFKKQQQEKYNKLSEYIMRFNSSFGNSHSSTRWA